MIYQFIYGRKNEGYCQINSSDNMLYNDMPYNSMPLYGMPQCAIPSYGMTDDTKASKSMMFQKNDLLKFENLKSYNISADIDKANLPQAYYFYNDDTSHGKACILGKTSHVPGRTSKESGDRDTSFLHKYIFINEDYQKVLNSPKELYRERIYFNNINEYKALSENNLNEHFAEMPYTQAFLQNENGSYFRTEPNDKKNNIGGESFQTESEGSINSFFDELSISNELLEKFIFCCLEVFPKYDKRIYCYLPSNDKSGSDKALKLMKLIMMTLPPCILSGAGYLTYSPTFHNAISNPIPGNISVVFIPRNEENLRNSKNEQEYNFIFDFVNNTGPIVNMSQMGAAMIGKIIKCIYEQNLTEVEDIYNELNKAISQYKPVDSGFLGAFYLYYLFNNMYKLNKANCIKFKKTIVMALKDMSRYQEEITDYGNTLIINVINTLLNCIDYDEVDLELIDLTFEYSRLCKNIIIRALSDKCLETVNEKRDDKLFLIVDHPFQNNEITILLMQKIYSDKEYYSATYMIVARSLNVLINSRLNAEKKIVKVLEAVDSLYQQYPGLAKTEEFIIVIKDALDIILSKDLDSIVANAECMRLCIDNLTEQYLDCTEYEKISEEICYNIMREKIDFDMETRDELEIFYKWCHKLFTTNDRLVKKVFDKMEDERFNETLKSRNPNQITNLLEKHISNQAVIEKICQKYLSEICDMIVNYCGEDYDLHAYFPMFQCLMFSYDSDIYREIIYKTIKLNGMSGVREFYNLLKKKQRMNNEIKRMITECLQYILECESYRHKMSDDDECFLEDLGISDVIKKSGTRGKSSKENKVRRGSLFSKNK